MMKRGGEEEVLSSSLSSYVLSVSPEEEQSRDINTDSDVDSMKEPDWQKSLIAVTTEKEEDSGMTESRVSKAKLVASMSSSKVSPLRDLSTNWTGMRVAARRRRAGRRSRAAPCPRSSWCTTSTRAVC